MAARKVKSKKETAEDLEEVIDPAEVEEIKEEADTPEEKEEEPKEEKRIIVGFGRVNSIKNFLLDDSGDEKAAIEKIANKCINDFALKCSIILDTCVEIPSSVYTYVVFNERFAWAQQDDMTTKEGTKYVVITSNDDSIPAKIREAYILRNRHVLKQDEDDEKIMWANYCISDILTGDKAKAIKKIKNMFGNNMFPRIIFWYNFNDKINEWQYVYNIIASENGGSSNGDEK